MLFRAFFLQNTKISSKNTKLGLFYTYYNIKNY